MRWLYELYEDMVAPRQASRQAKHGIHFALIAFLVGGVKL